MDTLKRVRRLTLIDLLLLVVMLGVLVPWIVQMDRKIDVGPYRAGIDERRRNGGLTLILDISLPAGADLSEEGRVGWMIYDESDVLLHEEYDLSPLPGKSREFIFRSESYQALRCEISAGNSIVGILAGEEG